MSYSFAFLDEQSKRAVRRALLKAVALPGYQVPFVSRELPISYGWGTGGIQITCALLGREDVVKVIDQGADDSVNAVNIKRFLQRTAGVATTSVTAEATIIQTRHRIPEERLRADQILVLQVPYPEPLRLVEARETETRRMHAEADYGRMYVALYEDIVHHGEITLPWQYPAVVNSRYLMSPSPIPRFDNPKLHLADCLFLFGAGREKRVYAIPPHTPVASLAFEDYPFRAEAFPGRRCERCGSGDTYLDELILDESGRRGYQCSDTAFCLRRRQDPSVARGWGEASAPGTPRGAEA
jgi:alpha-D-ribose 1-methylphosphonate 5-phosphate C-P lyase